MDSCHSFAEVFWVCTNHALTTEAEEIMGLLLGDVSVSHGQNWLVSLSCLR